MSNAFAGQPWSPAMFTPPLAEDFTTDGDRLLEIIDLAWQSPETPDFHLDPWQRALVRHVLERYPDDWPEERMRGRLRFRQVVISMGRQNGKSVLGGIFALYGLLMHSSGPEVVSVASTVEQANIIYRRVKHVIDNNPSLKKRFRATGTRGIRSAVDGVTASYVVKTGKEESLQGVTISLCLFDEIHISKSASWDAVVFGTSAQRDGLVLGITTAGDDNSDLLKRLYEIGKATITGGEEVDERFGFFLWEAPEHLKVTDPQALVAANPSIACGRMDLAQEINAIKSMPENQARRYRLNQFVSAEAAWLPLTLWHGAQKAEIPAGAKIVLAVDRAENWTAATITASAKVEGRIYTEVVASLVNPSLESLEELLLDLWRRIRPMKIFMEASMLHDLVKRLRERGVPCEFLTTVQMQNTCATAYALLTEGKVTHADDWVVNAQMGRAVSKNVGEGWRISRRDSVGEIDAVLATVIGIYAADITKPTSPQLFVA